MANSVTGTGTAGGAGAVGGFVGAAAGVAAEGAAGAAWDLGIRAERSLPSARFLFMRQNLLRYLYIAFGCARPNVVQNDRFAMAGGLSQADAARNDGLENL